MSVILPGANDWANQTYGARELCYSLAMNLQLPDPNQFVMKALLDKVNLAQVQVVLDCRLLETYTSYLTTTASTRSYSISTAWGIKNFLALRHFRIDGYEVFPLPNGFRDLDLKNNLESNRVSGYFIEGGTFYLEPIPDSSLTIDFVYLRKPVALSLDSNNTIEMGNEYVEPVMVYAAALWYPIGSVERRNAKAEYDDLVQTRRITEHNRTSS